MTFTPLYLSFLHRYNTDLISLKLWLLNRMVFVVIMRQLGHHTTGYLTWKGGINSAMVATIDRRSDNHHVTANLQVIKSSVFTTMLFNH